MLKALFYARFHPEKGPSVIEQYPEHSVASRLDTNTSGKEALFAFSDISTYIIPPYDLCDRPLSVCINGYRVLGFPVSLEDAKYERNRFTFNVCFVLGENADVAGWEPVMRKTVSFFRSLEVED